MTVSFSVRKEAEADISEAYEYYESCQEGLGADFVSCVEESFTSIKKNPSQVRAVYGSVHRSIVRRFPYGVYYVVINNNVSVIGVVHARKNPDHWRART